MADLKISALNSLAGADLVAADVVAVVDDSASETKKLTVSDLIANGVTLISDATIPSAKILFSAGAIDTAELAASAVETAKINDSAVTAAKLADNSSVTLVSTLPASGDFTGQIALDTDDDKIYVWDGSAWDSVKGAGSINVVNGSTTGEINIVTSTSGDTVTVSATLDDTTAAAQFLAGPTGAGGTVGYRAIIGTDLPTATTTAKGGVIVNGNGLTMSSDTIAIDNTVTAEATDHHIVQYDANGLVTGGRVIAAADVPVATSTTVGVVKPGSGLGVTAAGELNHDNSVTAGTASKVTFDTEGHITGTESLVAADIPDLDADKITTGTLPTARIASDAVTADKLADRSTATIAETTPDGGAFIGQTHLNSITGDYFLWDGNVWQPIGISVGEIVLAGTYDASTNLVATVTSEGTAVGYEVGSALPAASDSNKGYYVIVSEAGTGTSPAPTVALNPPDFLLSNGSVHTEIDVSDTVTAQQASNVQFTAAGNIAATNVQSAIEELDTEKVGSASPTFTGTVSLGEDAVITFEGATDNAFETTLSVVDPTADRTLSLPNVSGTLVSTGDTGTVTSTMITDGTIVNADISASAEIAVSKLANGTARQLLQTDVAGTGVEFTSNIDVPGTLDVTGAATLDSTLTVTGVINADGKVKFPAGTASAPSFYSGTDTNTGLYFSAADEISVATGGTQRVVVDSSGRVLIGDSASFAAAEADDLQIGSTSSASHGLTVKSSTGGYLIFADSADSDVAGFVYSHVDNSLRVNVNAAERLRIDSSGNVGIGTTSPGYKIEVTEGSGNSVARFTGANSANLVFRNATSNVFELNAGGSNDELSFGTAGNNERLRIDSSGRLSVGNTSASSMNSAMNNFVLGSGSGSEGMVIYSGSSDSGFIGFNDAASATTQGVIEYNHSGNYMGFRTADAERLRIDSSGRLLVGTSSSSDTLQFAPALQVEGSSAATSAVSALRTSDDANPVYIGLAKKRGSSGSVSNNDLVGKLIFMGFDGSNYQEAAHIETQIDGTPGANDMPGRLVFSTTADGASSPSERLRIDSEGRVGINDTTPDARLDIGGDNADIRLGGTQYFRIKALSTGELTFNDNDTNERLRIGSAGQIGLGGANYGTSGQVLTSNGSSSAPTWQDASGGGGDKIEEGNTSVETIDTGSDGRVVFTTEGAEAARIDSSGNLVLGHTSAIANMKFGGASDFGSQSYVVGANKGFANGLAVLNYDASATIPALLKLASSRSDTPGTNTAVGTDDNCGGIQFMGNDGTRFIDVARIDAVTDGTVGTNDMPGRLAFFTTADGADVVTERMRITSEGYITNKGSSIYVDGLPGEGFTLTDHRITITGETTSTTTTPALRISRDTYDGELVSFHQDSAKEGTISVSGTTVSYNGGHLSRWSQTLTTDEHVGLLKGTVMTNLDEMCKWPLEARDEVLWTEDDKLPEGVSVGDVRFPARAAGFEDNEQLNKMAVSSVEGDPNVAGVIVNIDSDDDLNVAMTGDFIIRIAQGTTVARGDLLMSAGDGTAKPQDDDIVRSKTIAKVTSTTVSVTYPDGSYCVPCVLMAC